MLETSLRPDDMDSKLGYLAKFVQYVFRCPTKGRPRDCIHACPRYIHSGHCEPCKQFVELECYCEATGIVKPCVEWCEMEDAQKELIKCCRVRCAKIMQCGHQCPQICHPGRCAESKQCVENVIRYCSCERIERLFPCRGCGAKDQEVPCDDICAQLLKTYREAIVLMKNNPFKQQAVKQAAAEIETPSADYEQGVEAKEVGPSQQSMTNAENHQSESEGGCNDESKISDDDRVGIIHRIDPTTSVISGVTEQLVKNGKIPTVERPTDLVDTLTADPKAEFIVSQRSEPFHLGPVDQDFDLPENSSQSRVSRSSSRVSSYTEEDVPRQLDQEKIVKIMRSSTRRKKLIKCDQNEVINELQSSS